MLFPRKLSPKLPVFNLTLRDSLTPEQKDRIEEVPSNYQFTCPIFCPIIATMFRHFSVKHPPLFAFLQSRYNHTKTSISIFSILVIHYVCTYLCNFLRTDLQFHTIFVLSFFVFFVYFVDFMKSCKQISSLL